MLSFAPGETSKTIVIAILNDNVSELYETFQVLLSSAVGADLLVSTSSVTIKNDDSDAAGDRIADAQSVSLVPEAQSQIDAMIGDGLYNNKDVDFYRVELSAGQELSIDLDAAFADNGSVLSTLDGRIRVFDSTGLELTPGDVYTSGQGSSPNDFEDPNGTTSNYSDDFFVFTPALPGVYYIGVSSESNNSYDPTVVNSGYGNNASSSVGAYRLQLFSSMPPVPTLHVTQRDFDEADGTSTIKVTLDYASTQTITVDYAALPGTATSPADYTLASGTLTFSPGTIEKTIQINIVDDTALEGNERFQLVLSNAMNAPIAVSNTEFVIVDNEPNPIQYVRLVRDTGYDRHDLRTVNPELEGRVEGNLGSASARVEFDHDEDGVVDGFVSLTSSPSDFVYDPRISDTSLVDFIGTVPMRYRFAMTETNGTLIETSWEAFSYVLEEVPASAYVVTELSHSAGQTDSSLPGPSVSSGMQITGHVSAFETYYGDGYGGSSSSGGCDGPMGPFPEGGGPTGEPNGDFGNPNLGSGCGPTSGGDSVEGTDPPNLPLAIPVEIDLDMDGEVDVTTTTNTDQDFSKYFASFDSGYHTIQARALEWNEDYGMYLTGAWTSYSFYWENASALDVIELGLLNDTGYSDSDLNTADPRIVGELEQPFHNVTDVEVDFDLNGDGVADSQSSIDENAKFQFTPVGLAAGWRTIRVRSSAWDNDASAVIKGTWQSLGFYYDPIPLPEIQALALLVDDGASNSDKVTTNATLIGNVTQSDSDDLRLYFDFDQDGVADTTMTPQEDGQFLYNALELQPGAYTIDVWATRFSSIFGQTEIGPTQSFSFTLVAKPQSPLSVVDLALVADTGINKTDFVTSNPAIKGRLSGEGSVSRLTVEIDVNADGIVDATTTADTAGNFQFSPVGLSLGPHAISARGVSYNYADATLLNGVWESISFSLVESTNEAAIISEFGLVNDSGTPGDNHSEDARLSGRVLNDSSVVGVAVEFDVNGDGIPEQTVFSGPDGRFIIDPQLSMYGAVTVSARAVEYDPEAAATISGPWTNFSFVYENQADAAPVTSDLLFDSGDVASGEQPSLSGKVRYQHSNAGLRVEIDANGDGTSDYSAITDAYGQFQVHLPNLANNTASIDIRSIGTNPNTKAIQSETWQELSINYVIASSAAATIVNLALAEDTGSSSTDRVTTNPKITGGVSRKPTGRVMIVEVDTDGDNVANGTTIVGADLKWTYSPANLAVGSVTVSARTRDTAVDGQTLYGAWSNFTFTLQSPVNSGGSSEEQDQQGAIGDANNQADADRNAADGDLSDAISSANQAQDASVTAAENQFNADLAQAANVFAQAQATAAANYQAALVAFAGNNTTFNFEPLEWPDSPQLDRFTVPDDSTLPQPPRDKPDYQGPAFDFNSSGTYLAANNLAKSAYNTAVANANSARRTQDQVAQETYRSAIKTENDRAKNARQAAQDAYETAINSPASTDLDAARDNYNNAMQSATDAYWSSVDSANSARNSAIQSASSSAQSSYESAWNSYNSTATSAWNSLMSVLNSNPAPSQSAREAAWNSYSSTMLAAGKTRDQSNADTSHAFTDAAITANTAWYKALADAQKTLALAQNSAAKTYDDAVANHDNELRVIKIAATITREKAFATIARDTAKNNANAAQTRDKQLATNAKTEQLAIAGAKSTLWVAQANAKKSSLIAWNAAVGSPWTAYQVDLANNELSYFQSLSTAHNTHSQAVANAEKVRADAVADAAHQRAHDTADEKHTLAHGYSDAKSTYWTNP